MKSLSNYSFFSVQVCTHCSQQKTESFKVTTFSISSQQVPTSLSIVAHFPHVYQVMLISLKLNRSSLWLRKTILHIKSVISNTDHSPFGLSTRSVFLFYRQNRVAECDNSGDWSFFFFASFCTLVVQLLLYCCDCVSAPCQNAVLWQAFWYRTKFVKQLLSLGFLRRVFQRAFPNAVLHAEFLCMFKSRK